MINHIIFWACIILYYGVVQGISGNSNETGPSVILSNVGPSSAYADSSDSPVVLNQDWNLHDDIYGNYYIGNCTAVDFDSQGYLYVLHRGSRIWDANTFINYIYAHVPDGPIPETVLIKVNITDGSVIGRFLKDSLYLPHGLTIDVDGYIWITDVAMHQVFKFTPTDLTVPILTLGTRFIRGNDAFHFCQPTDVAVSTMYRQFFISDGYCNNRILKYEANGQLKGIYGQSAWLYHPFLRSYTLLVPHSLTLIESHDLVCVADRENFRIVCLQAGILNTNLPDPFLGYSDPTGPKQPVFTQLLIDDTGYINRPYALVYNARNSILYVIGKFPNNGLLTANKLFTAKIKPYPEPILKFETQITFPYSADPHDITLLQVTNDSTTFTDLFVADLSPTVWSLSQIE